MKKILLTIVFALFSFRMIKPKKIIITSGIINNEYLKNCMYVIEPSQKISLIFQMSSKKLKTKST